MAATTPAQLNSAHNGQDPITTTTHFVFTVKIVQAEGLSQSGSGSGSSRVVILSDENGARLAETQATSEDLNPRWDETFDIATETPLWMMAVVREQAVLDDQNIVGRGYLFLDPQRFGDGTVHDVWLDLDSAGRILVQVTAKQGQNDTENHPAGRTPENGVAFEEARTLTPHAGEGPVQTSKTEEAQHWTEKEVHVIPENNMWIIVPGLMLSIFLAAMDQTVVAIALPTIVRKLGTSSGYAWVGSAYMLTSGATSPFWGVLSDLTGRKPLLFFGMTLFMASSALCGAAQSMRWLIAARAVQGIGGGALVSMTQITIGDVVSLEKRAQFQGLIGATFGIAAVLGPVLGGLLTQVNWRWIFWVNIPVGTIGGLLLTKLNLNPVPRKSLREHVKNFDFIGLFLITTAVVCLLVGFTLSESGWSDPAVITLIAIAPVIFGLGILNEFLTKRRPILPPRLFRTRTTLILLLSVFLHAFSFFAASYYLPLYFQIRGAGIIVSALLMIPYSLSSSILSIVSGWYISTSKKWRPTLWAGWAITLLGYGLMIDMDATSSHVKEAIYTFIAGFGIGCLFQTPLIGMLSAMPQKDMALVTSATQLTRLLGGTVGISAGGAIYLSILRQKLDHVEGYDGSAIPNGDLINLVGSLSSIQPDDVRWSVVKAYAESLSWIWIVCTPLIGVGFLLVLCVRVYGMKRVVIKGGEKAAEEGQAPATSSEESTPTASPVEEKDSSSVPVGVPDTAPVVPVQLPAVVEHRPAA